MRCTEFCVCGSWHSKIVFTILLIVVPAFRCIELALYRFVVYWDSCSGLPVYGLRLANLLAAVLWDVGLSVTFARYLNTVCWFARCGLWDVGYCTAGCWLEGNSLRLAGHSSARCDVLVWWMQFTIIWCTACGLLDAAYWSAGLLGYWPTGLLAYWVAVY